MSNLGIKFVDKLEEFIKNGEHEHLTVQTKICLFVVERIYNRVLDDYYFGGIKINESENLIIDGNHRYIAYKLANIDFERLPSAKNSCDKPPYRSINDIEIDKVEDWDSNNIKTKKFCSDEFLNKLEKRIKDK